MEPADHLTAAQMWLKNSGSALVRARKNLASGNCAHGIQTLMVANRRLGVAQGHLASVGEENPRDASQKLRLNRTFVSLKQALAKTLEVHQSKCVR